MRCIPHLTSAALAAIVLAPPVPATVRVVATTPSLADITRQIGGSHVDVESIVRGPENIHNVTARPSSMMKLRRADLFLHSGLDAEPWVPQLVKGARRAHLLFGQPGNVDASRGIALKEVPQAGELSRALGDIHVYGNTHYLLDPLNGVIVARTIAEALSRAAPEHRPDFEANQAGFAEDVRRLTARLVERMEGYRGTPVATYHRTWPYFLDRFGLVKVAEVEPKPGIAPGPRHLSRCVETMRARDARIVIVETFNPRDNAEWVARRVEGSAVVLAHEVNAVPEAGTYQKLFRHNVTALLDAFESAGVVPRPEAGSDEVRQRDAAGSTDG